MTDRGPWIQTFTGKQFFPLDPRPEDVCVEDIARSLAMKCRYGGHTRFFYSVAEHSFWVSQNAPIEQRLRALLHDAHEAYSPFGDVPRPLKASIPQVAEIEERLDEAIAAHFGLDGLMSPDIKVIDTRILHDERAVLLGPPPADWGIPGEPLGFGLGSRGLWPCWYAERQFLAEFWRLTG